MRVTSKVALRGKRHNERVRLLNAAAPAGIRVVPQEKYRAVLAHPKAGGFPAEGGKEWPDDRFTKRRLADGSVTREEPPPPPEGEAQRDEAEQRPAHYRAPTTQHNDAA